MSVRFALAVVLPLSATACQDPDGSYAPSDTSSSDEGGAESAFGKAGGTRYEVEASSSQSAYNNLDLQRKQFQIKFTAFFLDDSCAFIGDENNNQMIPFWDQGDGDTPVAGVWGANQNIP